MYVGVYVCKYGQCNINDGVCIGCQFVQFVGYVGFVGYGDYDKNYNWDEKQLFVRFVDVIDELVVVEFVVFYKRNC